jgi:hypothetical protein
VTLASRSSHPGTMMSPQGLNAPMAAALPGSIMPTASPQVLLSRPAMTMDYFGDMPSTGMSHAGFASGIYLQMQGGRQQS